MFQDLSTNKFCTTEATGFFSRAGGRVSGHSKNEFKSNFLEKVVENFTIKEKE
jgi:hypothetical protein